MSLVAHWRLNEQGGTNAVDSVSTNDGTSANTIVTDNRGIIFDGATDLITVPDNATLDVGTGAFTLACWVKPVASDANGRMISKNKYYLAQSNSGSGIWHFVILGGASGNDYLGSDSAPITSEWSHVVGTRDASGNMRMYINGVVQSDKTQANPDDLDNASDFIIGATNTPDVWFNGSISDVRIYNEDLTAGQVSNLYLSTNGYGRVFRRIRRGLKL